MVFPILIASKNRPNQKIFSMLAQDSLDFKIIVEPQDQTKYKEWSEYLLVMPANDRGLTYARNFCLTYARSQGFPWVWIVDDDITKFSQFNPTENKITPAEAFTLAESLFLPLDNIAQASLEYRQYAWGHNIPLKFNSYCDVCVCININRTKTNKFKETLKLKGDRDFTLQILSSGYRVVRTAQISFQVPKNGSNQGGLYDIYKSNIEKENSLNMAKIWGPDICTPITKKDGRHDVKINWSYFKNN